MLPVYLLCSEDIAVTYAPPSPSTAGITGLVRYSYSTFPDLQAANFTTPRNVRALVNEPELGRRVDGKVMSEVLKKAAHSQLEQRSFRNIYAVSTDLTGALDERDALEKSLRQATERYHIFLRAVVILQAGFRRLNRIRTYRRFMKAVSTLQRRHKNKRFYRIAQALGSKSFVASIIVQKHARGLIARRKYSKLKKAMATLRRMLPMFIIRSEFRRTIRRLVRLQRRVKRYLMRFRARQSLRATRIQSVMRMFQIRRRFMSTIEKVRRVQAFYRGIRSRRIICTERDILINSLKHVLFDLWSMNATPLIVRSNFWRLLDKTSAFLQLGIYYDEYIQVCNNLELLQLQIVKKGDPISQQLLQTTAFLEAPQVSFRTRRNNGRSAREADVVAERNVLYLTMKKDRDERRRLVFFRKFGIETAKKRKRTLSDHVWLERARVDDSAAAVRDILAPSPDDDASWLAATKGARIAKDMSAIARCGLLGLQHANNRQSTDRALLRHPSSVERRNSTRLKVHF